MSMHAEDEKGRSIMKNWKVICLMGMLAMMTAPGALQASIVTLDMTVDGGTSPVTINIGETVLVEIYATVTDNNYNGTDLGLAGYAADILTSGGFLDPVEGWDGLGGVWDTQWDVQWGISDMSIRARGNADNGGHDDDVMGHGAAISLIDPNNDEIAVTRTLLASGLFEGVSEGTTMVSLSGASANAVWYNAGTGHFALSAGTLDAIGGAEVTVVPEPATLSLLAIGAVGLIRRRRVGTK
ncbi:MAG: PEP-CTERM sorting domain-containing protein [Phycisphaerales bacterium]|jgi:hypothetical protein|nr:PEP-CTERM sorting domain-containing protein [Phycisphaerales bacterium]